MRSEKQQIAEELAVLAVRLRVVGEEACASRVTDVVADLVWAIEGERGARREEEEGEGVLSAS